MNIGKVIEISKQQDRVLGLYIEGSYTTGELINMFDYLANALHKDLSDGHIEAVKEFLKECNPPTKKARRNIGKPHGNKRKQHILEVLRGKTE
ncbi:hypothetical protein [Bacillus cereus]|uniref:hypothetical protein n=1 Tax=Bacillus cereus TaxID=1396 RepID=UPI0024BD1D24|nr:hypothetical protein [Bacillus cereus]WLG16078.1 hypothetical protein QM226_005548 [Bacillus cereus]